MGVEYTENLKLGIQTDKNDFVDWDAITENWQKLDAAYSGMQSGSAKPETVMLSTTAAHPEPIWPEAVSDFTPDE